MSTKQLKKLLYILYLYIYSSTNPTLHRYTPSDKMVEKAREFRDGQRNMAIHLYNYSTEREDQCYRFISLWENYMKKDEKTMVEELHGGIHPAHFRGPAKDQLALRAALKRLSESQVFDFHKLCIFNRFNGGSSLLDFLVCHLKDSQGAFMYPSLDYLRQIQNTRTISKTTATSNHEFKEITIGVSSDEEVSEAIAFFNSRYAKDQAQCPTGVISFDCEDLHIDNKDYSQLPTHLTGKPVVFRCPRKGVPAKMLPVRAILGGLSWTLSIRTNILTEKDEDGEKVHTVYNSRIQKELAEFMQNLPTATGCAVRNDIPSWEGYMKTLGYKDFKMKNGWIEIYALAFLAGFHARHASMFNFNLQVLGGILPKNNSIADHLWGVPVEDLPSEFKAYIIGDTRCSHHVYSVLFSILLNQTFPDPDSACGITATSQYEFAVWFGEFLRGMLTNVEYFDRAYESAVTREELALCLRIREPSVSTRGAKASALWTARVGLH